MVTRRHLLRTALAVLFIVAISAAAAYVIVQLEPAPFAATTALPKLEPVQAEHPRSAKPAKAAPPLYWQFLVKASARDDPEVGRSFNTSISWQGATTSSCPAVPSLLGHQVERTGNAAAQLQREATLCLPGCPGRSAPDVQHYPLERKVDMLAGQESFDRAPADFAPSGDMALVQWSCEGKQYRITATAAAALACNSPGCDDVQVANVAVGLERTVGRVLDEPAIVLPWEDTARHVLMGQVKAQATNTH